MSYFVEFKEDAMKELGKFDKKVAQRILNKIKWLAENFENVSHERLKGEEWEDMFKLRVGDYRVIYSVDRDKKIITIHLVGHRSEIYK